MEYYVSPSGKDENPGTDGQPFGTISRGLHGASPTSSLQPGDVLFLRGGTYVEDVYVRGLAGTPGHEITIQSFPGERAVIDSGIRDFRTVNNSQWVPASTVVDPPTHPDEWVSCQPFPPPAMPSRGAFLDMPYRRLITYSSRQDFRADNQTFDLITVGSNDTRPGPWRVTDEAGNPLKVKVDNQLKEFTYPWVYMGPGIWHDPEKHLIHIRLTHTTNNVPGLEDYDGPTDPNELALAICDVNQRTLRIADSRCLVFKDLTVRFGGDDTVLIDNCQCISFDQVVVWASTGGVRFGGSLAGATFRNCRFDGGLPPWFFRGDRKNGYWCRPTEGGTPFENKLGKATIDVLMYGAGFDRRDVEIDHCEFANGHDLYLVASNMHFHHNWIDNLHDEGMMLDVQPSAGGRIHSNVITRCLSPISMADKGTTSDHWYIYRNLIDLRVPTAGRRPRSVGDTAVWRFGTMLKSNEVTAPDGPYDLFHNTFLVNDQVFEQAAAAAYVHYRSALSPHPRRSFNNIFVAVNPDPTADIPIAFVPPPSFPGPTDGNLYHRIGAANAAAFIVVDYALDCRHHPQRTFGTLGDLHHSDLFDESKRQYPPGYEATSLLTDPQFQHLAADGAPDPPDDLRLAAGSPALSAGIPLSADLQDLDDGLQSPPAAPSRDIGCYRSGSPPLRVGVEGRRSFPGVPPP